MFDERFNLIYLLAAFAIVFYAAVVVDATRDIVGYFRGRRIR